MIVHHTALLQGSDEWLQMRCGLLTASVMEKIVTPAQMKPANNATSRGLLYELAAQRITKYVEPSYISDDMLRGTTDEDYYRDEYFKNFGPVDRCGFITNDKWGFTLGFSPDGLVGVPKFIEGKSRKQKLQLEFLLTRVIPGEDMIQMQTGMLVSERDECDYISYCGGMPMVVVPVEPIPKLQAAIIDAARQFHEKLDTYLRLYGDMLADKSLKLIPTERRIQQEIALS